MDASGIGSGLQIMFRFFVVGMISIFCWVIYAGYKLCTNTVVESKVKVIPDYRLTVKGKEVDTVYIYTFKK